MSHAESCRIDGVHQRPRGDQTVNREPIRRRRHTTIRPLLTHRDPAPPIELAQAPQPRALPHRDQHGQTLKPFNGWKG